MPATRSFVGGMNVPGMIGRMNASVPLARLVLGGTTLRLQPRGFGRLMLTDFVVPLDTIEAAYRLHRTPMTWGVGFRLHDGILAYFWTFNGEAVLAALTEYGVTVEPGRHRARGLWKLRSSPIAAATVPTFPALLITLIPALILASTALMIVFVLTAEPWELRVWSAVVWLASTACLVALWRKSRARPGHP